MNDLKFKNDAFRDQHYIFILSLDCDVIVQFAKPQLMGALGVVDQTNFEMGSFASKPCGFRSSKVTSMKVVYTKNGSEFRANQVPTYGPVGINSCIGRGDRPYENYSMLKNYESLSLAKKYCSMYEDCDIIVEIDRSQGWFNNKKLFDLYSLLVYHLSSVAGRNLNRLYEIGNTNSSARDKCRPRPQNGVKVSRVNFERQTYRAADIPAPVYVPTESPRYSNQDQG